jgi:hypothetical protein
MAMRPAPLRRTATVVPTPASKPKPVVNLEDWDAKTQLNESVLRTVHKIEVASKNVPLPLKVRHILLPSFVCLMLEKSSLALKTRTHLARPRL